VQYAIWKIRSPDCIADFVFSDPVWLCAPASFIASARERAFAAIRFRASAVEPAKPGFNTGKSSSANGGATA